MITTDADRLSCRLWNFVARNTGSGDAVLTRLPMLAGGTNKVGRLSRVVGTIYRIIQGCYGNDAVVLPILELKLELEVSGWWTGLLGTAIARAERSIVMKGKELQQRDGVALPCVGGFGAVPRNPGFIGIEGPLPV